MKRTRLLVACAAGLACGGGYAHHSVAPYYYTDRSISISGTITGFEARNPHAYLHIEAVDANGRSQNYVCESSGISTLRRNGVTADLFKVGEKVRVEGLPSRRDPHGCFFRSVRLADGRIVKTSGNERKPKALRPHRDSIYGTWFIVPAGRHSSGPWAMIHYLTPAGERAVEHYDPFRDDPTLRCSPVGIRRLWSAPSEPLNIRRDGNKIIIHYEWMDAVRTIYLDPSELPADAPPTTLGRSIGHFEGDTLVVETASFAPGVLRQYVEEKGKPTRGLLHSDQLEVVERIHFDPEAQTLNVLIQRTDPKFFTRPFLPISIDYAPSDTEIARFNCKPGT